MVKEKRDIPEEEAAPAPAHEGDGAGLSTADVGARVQINSRLMEQQLSLFAELRTMARKHGDPDLTRMATIRLTRCATGLTIFRASLEAAGGDEKGQEAVVLEAGMMAQSCMDSLGRVLAPADGNRAQEPEADKQRMPEERRRTTGGRIWGVPG